MRRPDDMTLLLERQYLATELRSGAKQALEMPCFIGSCGGNIQHPNAQSTVCPTASEVRSNNKGHNNDTANGSRRAQEATPSPRPKGRQEKWMDEEHGRGTVSTSVKLPSYNVVNRCCRCGHHLLLLNRSGHLTNLPDFTAASIILV